ncbi:NAD(P)/FAD-dependent oxidoreductase [Roseateles sp.]|uniref:flavin monoamine oxidase family protein n=1 Tax=Roseateles sp. TaxID=1971397 RepID=UPI002F3EE99C
MDRHDTFTTDDFAEGLHLGLHGPRLRRHRPTAALAGQPTIPDEDVPLRQLFTRIIDAGLTSLHGKPKPAHVLVVGAGPAGLCAAHELKRAGLTVSVFESSHRVGGRVKTITAPFTPELHGEGGAMRLPQDHELVHAYLDKFKLKGQLEPFEQANKLIYLSTYGRTLTYDEFNRLLVARDPGLLACFPKLREEEKGKTIDTLWDAAVQPVVAAFESVYRNDPANIAAAYRHVTALYDRYSLQTFFEQVAGWSQDCISLYDLGSPHVVLDNAFIESWKDAFLSSQSGGETAGMQQMAQGMQQIPSAFIAPGLDATLKDDIRYGARVVAVNHWPAGGPGRSVEVLYRTNGGETRSVFGDRVIFAVPFTVQRLIKTNVPFGVPKTNAIRELRYVEVTKILLQFKTRWWEQYLEGKGQGKDGGVVTDLPIRYAMFPVSTSAQFKHGQERGVIMASYTFQQDATGTGGMNKDASVEIAVDNLSTIFGKDLVQDNFEVGTSQVWSADAFSGGSAFAYFAPMQKTRLFHAMIAPEWNGHAHFAGEHNSYSHGWIEGAFQSALRTAYQVYLAQLPR